MFSGAVVLKEGLFNGEAASVGASLFFPVVWSLTDSIFLWRHELGSIFEGLIF